MTYQKSFPGMEKWEVAAWIMDIYWSVHQRRVKTTGKVFWLQTFGGTRMKGRGTMSLPIDAGR